jgi:hypothetical protein
MTDTTVKKLSLNWQGGTSTATVVVDYNGQDIEITLPINGQLRPTAAILADIETVAHHVGQLLSSSPVVFPTIKTP